MQDEPSKQPSANAASLLAGFHGKRDLARIGEFRPLMQLGCAENQALAAQIADHRSAVMKAAFRVGTQKAIAGRTVEPVAPAVAVEPQ